MSNNNCSCRTDCTGLAVVASIIIGIITTFLVFTNSIIIPTILPWVLFAVAVAALGVLLLITSRRGRRICTCTALPTILTGVLGTIFAAIILLAVDVATTSLIYAIVSGALLLFFSLIVTSATCLIKCLSDCDEE